MVNLTFSKSKCTLYSVHTGGFMKVSTKELRIHPGKIIEYAASGHDVTVTYRGKPMVKISAIDTPAAADVSIESAFGIWKTHEDKVDVDKYLRDIRKGRTF